MKIEERGSIEQLLDVCLDQDVIGHHLMLFELFQREGFITSPSSAVFGYLFGRIWGHLVSSKFIGMTANENLAPPTNEEYDEIMSIMIKRGFEIKNKIDLASNK